MNPAKRNHPMTRLLDGIVFLEVVDARHVAMNAARYLAAARSVREIVERELGGLDMREFVIAALPTLRTTAENIFFDTHGHFADLDGSGNARRGHEIVESLLQRLARPKSA